MTSGHRLEESHRYKRYGGNTEVAFVDQVEVQALPEEKGRRTQGEEVAGTGACGCILNPLSVRSVARARGVPDFELNGPPWKAVFPREESGFQVSFTRFTTKGADVTSL
jgi:hypothetical protein